MRTGSVVLAVVLLLWIAAPPAQAVSPSGAVAVELLGGTLGGVVGAGLGVVAIGAIVEGLESRAARVATVITGVTVGGGLGAAGGVLTAGWLLGLEGSTAGCLIGALAGGLASAFVEPLFYMLGVREGVTELLGLLLLPIVPAVGATIGFNWPVERLAGLAP